MTRAAPVTVRPIRVDDAEAYLALGQALDQETRFMLLEPGERTLTPTEQGQRIAAVLAAPNQMIFVAETAAGELVGCLGGLGGAYRRSRAAVHIFVGVRQAYAGQGVGRALFAALETWARGWGAHRLELTVMCHNHRARALYRRLGFTTEGRLRGTLCVDGVYVDEFIMSKLLV